MKKEGKTNKYASAQLVWYGFKICEGSLEGRKNMEERIYERD